MCLPRPFTEGCQPIGLQVMRFIFMFLFVVMSGCVTSGSPDVNSSPEIGVWEVSADTISCTETFTFNVDGTLDIVSGAQRITEKYLLIGLEEGFYELSYQTIYSNGEPSCYGKIEGIEGSRHTFFLKFSRDLDSIEAFLTPDVSEPLGVFFKRIK